MKKFKRKIICCEPNFRENAIDEIISNDASYPHERDLYLKVIKWFNLMRIRMKISYMALIK